MKIVICEDEPVYQVALRQAITHWQQTTGSDDVEIACMGSADELLDQFEQNMEIDLCFIDIQINGSCNGVELARKIRKTQQDVTLVFCTNYSEYVYEGYTVNALRFLRKPVQQADVSFCCSYVYNRRHISNARSLTIYSFGRRMVLRYSEIRFLEIQAHDLFISTTLRPAPFKTNVRLSQVMAKLPRELFVLCHRSYAVNISHVRMLTRKECLLLGGESIPISRTYLKDVSLAFDRYHQGGVCAYGMDDL